jgi:periplasmic protein TonB
MSAPYRHHPLQAFGLAVAIELGLLAGAAVILGTASQTRSALSETMPIELEDAEQPSLKPPEPKPERPVPPRPKQPAPPPPKQEPPPPQQPPTPQAAQPTAFTEPAPPPPSPAPAASAANAKPSDIYAAGVHAAVQAAHYYPPAAEALRYAGRVRVEFHLRDGVPGAARLLSASGIGLIDRAALQAVESARYPETPPELRGSDLVFQVWIEFDRRPI